MNVNRSDSASNHPRLLYFWINTALLLERMLKERRYDPERTKHMLIGKYGAILLNALQPNFITQGVHHVGMWTTMHRKIESRKTKKLCSVLSWIRRFKHDEQGDRLNRDDWEGGYSLNGALYEQVSKNPQSSTLKDADAAHNAVIMALELHHRIKIADYARDVDMISQIWPLHLRAYMENFKLESAIMFR